MFYVRCETNLNPTNLHREYGSERWGIEKVENTLEDSVFSHISFEHHGPYDTYEEAEIALAELTPDAGAKFYVCCETNLKPTNSTRAYGDECWSVEELDEKPIDINGYSYWGPFDTHDAAYAELAKLAPKYKTMSPGATEYYLYETIQNSVTAHMSDKELHVLVSELCEEPNEQNEVAHFKTALQMATERRDELSEAGAT
jgi:hypothetical protein